MQKIIVSKQSRQSNDLSVLDRQRFSIQSLSSNICIKYTNTFIYSHSLPPRYRPQPGHVASLHYLLFYKNVLLPTPVLVTGIILNKRYKRHHLLNLIYAKDFIHTLRNYFKHQKIKVDIFITVTAGSVAIVHGYNCYIFLSCFKQLFSKATLEKESTNV